MNELKATYAGVSTVKHKSANIRGNGVIEVVTNGAIQRWNVPNQVNRLRAESDPAKVTPRNCCLTKPFIPKSFQRCSHFLPARVKKYSSVSQGTCRFGNSRSQRTFVLPL